MSDIGSKIKDIRLQPWKSKARTIAILSIVGVIYHFITILFVDLPEIVCEVSIFVSDPTSFYDQPDSFRKAFIVFVILALGIILFFAAGPLINLGYWVHKQLREVFNSRQ